MLVVILVVAAVALSLVLGVLAKMSAKEITALSLGMVAAALIFYGLVELL